MVAANIASRRDGPCVVSPARRLSAHRSSRLLASAGGPLSSANNKMRFSGRQGEYHHSTNTNPQALNATTADVVLQLGDVNIPKKAEKILGTNVKVAPTRRQSAAALDQQRRRDKDQEKAVEALSRMQEELSWTRDGGAARSGRWAPWSPDDLYPDPRDSKLYPPTPQHGDNDSPDELRREPSDANLPAYYDPADQPSYVSQQTSASAVRDMALHKGAPTIFDDHFGEPLHERRSSLSSAMKQHDVSRRKTTASKPRKLDLVQLFPQPRPSTGRLLSPSRLQHSPSAMADQNDCALPPLPPEPQHSSSNRPTAYDAWSHRPSTAASTMKNRDFDADILDQHKTNVRRPPKGIQNWFDAFLDTDDDDDDADDEAVEDGPEPQELPADEIMPPAYHPPTREMSRLSEKSAEEPLHRPMPQTRSLDPVLNVHQALGGTQEQEELTRYRDTTECHSWDSIQSSHLGYPCSNATENRIGSNSRAGQSVLSLSDSDYEGEVGTNSSSGSQIRDRPQIRDSILDYRNVTVGAASQVGVQKLQQKPQQLQTIRSLSHGSKETEAIHETAMAAVSQSTALQTQTKAAIHVGIPPQPTSPSSADRDDMRRLDGVSSKSSSKDSNGVQTVSGSPTSELPQDAAHMMVVTEEERALLDLMRRKRAMMQQLSFTEGYQLALQTEQERLARRTESAQKSAMKALQRKELERRDSQLSSPRLNPTMTRSDSDMRRHVSVTSSSDERLQIERFLGMPQPQPLSSHPLDMINPSDCSRDFSSGSTKPRQGSGELLPATVYTPAATPSVRSPGMTQSSGSLTDDGDSDSIKRRVDHFIATNGAVPPFNSDMKTMRKKSSSRTAASGPPSPVFEEDHPPPMVPKRSPARPQKHQRAGSDQSQQQIHHKLSSISMDADAEPRDKSPVQTFSSRQQPASKEEHYIPLLPSKPEFREPAYLQRSGTMLSAMTSSPELSSMSPISPFSSIIQRASVAPKPHGQYHPQNSVEMPDNEYFRPRPNVAGMSPGTAHIAKFGSPPSFHGPIAADRQRPVLPPPSHLNTIDAAFQSAQGLKGNPYSGAMNPTTAGEDVLAAWKELGGGSVRTAKRPMGKPSGPLSGVMNS